MLRQKLGDGGPLAFIYLLAFAAEYRRYGRLEGMDDTAIAQAAAWKGEPPALVATLHELRLLDRSGGVYSIHDWARWQPHMADYQERVERGRRNAAKRWGKDTQIAPPPPANPGAAPAVPLAATATTIPAGFALTVEMAYYALTHGLKPELEFEKFKAHAEENETKHRKWELAWQRWCRNAVDYYKRDHDGHEPPCEPIRPIARTNPTDDPVELARRRFEDERRATLAATREAMAPLLRSIGNLR